VVPVIRDETVHEPFGEWSALAAIGALDGPERARFDAHLAGGCAICQVNLRELSRAAAALPWALPDQPLRPEVRGRLMERVAAQGREPVAFGAPARRGRGMPGAAARRPWQWAGGLVAAGLATALVWGLHDSRQALELERTRAGRLEQELARERAITALVAHTDTHVAPLRGLDAAARADGWIVWSPSQRQGFIVVHNLPVLGTGQEYRLWEVSGAAWNPAGAFHVDAIGHAALTVRVEHGHPDGFAVTVEPAGPGRHTAPTGPTLMQGSPPR
jgi:hypothetical protein